MKKNLPEANYRHTILIFFCYVEQINNKTNINKITFLKYHAYSTCPEKKILYRKIQYRRMYFCGTLYCIINIYSDFIITRLPRVWTGRLFFLPSLIPKN